VRRGAIEGLPREGGIAGGENRDDVRLIDPRKTPFGNGS